MKSFVLLTIAAAFGLMGFGSQRAEETAGSQGSIFRHYDFPSHPTLTHLCQQRVHGSIGHITWDAFASAARPSALRDYYHRKLGDAGFDKRGDGASWRLPADAPRPNRILEIIPIGTNEPFRDCEKAPPSDSRAIIRLSRMN